MSNNAIDPRNYPSQFERLSSETRRFYSEKFRELLAGLFNTDRQFSLQNVHDSVQPSIVIPQSQEWNYLMDEHRFSAGSLLLQDAANISRICLMRAGTEAKDSSMVLVDEVSFSVSATTNVIVTIGHGFTGPLDNNQETAVDTRNMDLQGVGRTAFVPSLCSLRTGHAQAVTAEQTIWQGQLLANTPFAIHPDIVLYPAFPVIADTEMFVSVQTTQINVALTANFKWRERGMNPLELPRIAG